MQLIGTDPGFGNVKLATIEHLAVVPSVVGIGDTDLGALNIGDLTTRRGRLPDRTAFDNVAYLVGENVAEHARPVQRMDLHRLSNGPELRALFYDSIYRLLGAGQHEASLMIGLPVEVMSDRSLARSTLRSLRDWIVGAHSYTVNGDHVALTVHQVRAMAQPAGSFFAWGLDNAGNWRRGPGALKAPVAVCDIGFNTLDLFAIKGGSVTKRFTGGDTLGMRRAAETLRDVLRARYGRDISPHEADALLQERDPVLYCSEGAIDIADQCDQARRNAAAGVVSYVEEHWGSGRQFAHLLFTGGGAAALRPELVRQYPHGVVLPDPVTANAVGLARYAVRSFD
jgi:hypothetical protein